MQWIYFVEDQPFILRISWEHVKSQFASIKQTVQKPRYQRCECAGIITLLMLCIAKTEGNKCAKIKQQDHQHLWKASHCNLYTHAPHYRVYCRQRPALRPTATTDCSFTYHPSWMRRYRHLKWPPEWIFWYNAWSRLHDLTVVWNPHFKSQ